ncbi:hypothetical protein SDC64_02675 [Acinetobacter haemolyticus]|uniref:hypothetical protein n=1 Tax=Acinetobacter haemolyticus TaxID=29430 RepID=UPI002A6AC566|nr:hypothetical protein [Acinetobacter haemolyticus]WPO67858.1 hypothetical protein SDC64_02675 [Acinetobacter haemolyticus]
MQRTIIILLSSLMFGCTNDIVTTKFIDLQHAQTEHAFERGWLPPILPPSTKNIIEINNLDLNIGHGSFTFSPTDLDYFIDHGAVPIKINDATRGTKQKLQDQGFQFFIYTQDSSVWHIATHPNGKGAYWIETIR